MIRYEDWFWLGKKKHFCLICEIVKRFISYPNMQTYSGLLVHSASRYVRTFTYT